MPEPTKDDEILSQPLPMQDHRCTAVIEDLCEATPEDAWDDVDAE